MNGQSTHFATEMAAGNEAAPMWKVIRYGRTLVLMVVVGAVFELAAQRGIHISGPVRVIRSFLQGDNVFLGSAFIGSFTVLFAIRPARSLLARTVLLGLVLELGLLSLRLLAHRRGWELLANAGSGLGMAAIVMMAWKTWTERATRIQSPIVVLAAAAIPGFVVLTEPFLEMTAHFHPLTMDGVIYAADGTLGMQGSFVLARMLDALPPLKLLTELVYGALPAALGWIIALELSNAKTRMQSDLLTVFISAGVIGFMVYHLYPVAGPMYAFLDEYPKHAPVVTDAYLAPMPVKWIARNCVPSMHTTWALLIFLHARPFGGRVRAIAGAFLGITLLATVGLGYHYVLDLVVAVPFTLLLQGLFSPAWTGRARWRSVGVGAAMLGAWLLVLRTGVPVLMAIPGLTWLLVAATVGVSIRLETDRIRAVERVPGKAPDRAAAYARTGQA